jgi:hypothetical protein
MLDKKIPEKDKHTHVGPAIHTCREVLSLFQDKTYTLWKVPVPASELLINVSSPYFIPYKYKMGQYKGLIEWNYTVIAIFVSFKVCRHLCGECSCVWCHTSVPQGQTVQLYERVTTNAMQL